MKREECFCWLFVSDKNDNKTGFGNVSQTAAQQTRNIFLPWHSLYFLFGGKALFCNVLTFGKLCRLSFFRHLAGLTPNYSTYRWRS